MGGCVTVQQLMPLSREGAKTGKSDVISRVSRDDPGSRRAEANTRKRESYSTASRCEPQTTLAGASDAARGRQAHQGSRVGRYGHRNATLILLAYRHGLRVSELVAMRWDQIDLEQGYSTSRGLRTACRRPIRSRPGDSSAPATTPRVPDRPLRLHDRASRRNDRRVGAEDHWPSR